MTITTLTLDTPLEYDVLVTHTEGSPFHRLHVDGCEVGAREAVTGSGDFIVVPAESVLRYAVEEDFGAWIEDQGLDVPADAFERQLERRWNLYWLQVCPCTHGAAS